MNVYFGRPFGYINEIKDLKQTRIAFSEDSFKTNLKKKTFSLDDYISHHFSQSENIKVLAFYENGESTLNNVKVDSVTYPNREPQSISKVLVLNIPSLGTISNVKKAAITKWCNEVIERSLEGGYSTHLSKQSSPVLAMKLVDRGLTSVDIDASATQNRIIFPDGSIRGIGAASVKRKIKSWSYRFNINEKAIISGDRSELIRFNINSLNYLFSDEGRIDLSKTALSNDSEETFVPKRFEEKDLPEEVKGLALAFEEKDDTKIISGVMRLLKEETLRYYEIRHNEKYSKNYDFDTSRMLLGIVGKIVDVLKVSKPEMVGEVNKYFIDNRKIILSAVIKEYDGIDQKGRKELIDSLKELQQERKRSGNRGNVVVVGEPAV